MARLSLPPVRPLVIAHRAGNDAATASAAHEAGADLVEADVWLAHGRIELRHTKTLGPVPLLWDRWLLAPGWTPRLQLGELLDAIAPETGLLLDLKGRDPRLPLRVAETLARSTHAGAVAVCARRHQLLEPLAGGDDGFALWCSAGTGRQLAALLAGGMPAWCTGVSVHQQLLDAEMVRRLKQVVRLVVSWPVNDSVTLETLLAWGIDGVTTDDPAVVRELVSRR